MDVISYLLGKNSGGGSKPPVLQDKEVTITENGTTNITADEGYDGLSEVEVTTDVSSSINDYFNTSTSAGSQYYGNWVNLVKELPANPITITGSGLNSLFRNYPGVSIPQLNVNEKPTSTNLMFSSCSNMKSIDISNIDLSNVSDTSSMFNFCSKLESLKISNTLSDKLTNTSSMFGGCYVLKQVPLFDTSKVTNMSRMFYDCRALETALLFDTSSATNMSSMFSNCYKLEEIPTFNTSNVTNMSSMFSNCESLKTIPVLNTSKVTSFASMFYQVFNLTDNSLDNILQMCINATSYTGVKTLNTLNINNTTYYPASRIQALPHYQDFIDAGWTIGY